jgi:hypothetical protein
LISLLSDDIGLSADGGGKAPALGRVLQGKAEVAAFVAESLRRFWAGLRWVNADLNGGRGVIVQQNGATVAAVSFACDEEDKATNIYIMRNPDKLSHLGTHAIP